MKAKRVEEAGAEAAGDLPAWVDGANETAAPAEPERRTAEDWAQRKGMFERFLAPSGEFARPNPLYQDWAQARAHGAWPEGKELTEAEFDAAVEAAKGHTFR